MALLVRPGAGCDKGLGEQVVFGSTRGETRQVTGRRSLPWRVWVQAVGVPDVERRRNAPISAQLYQECRTRHEHSQTTK